MRLESASAEEWSAFMEAACRVNMGMVVHERHLAVPDTDPSKINFNFTESAPQFHHLDDANEYIQRLWSICIQTTDQQQLMRDRVEKDSS